MTVLIGASGWQYKDWRERFYPKGVAQKVWLEFYAERFQIVELNNSFYRLPKPEQFAAWAARTPDDFIVGVKASRYLTHIKRLKESEEPVERFLKHAKGLGSKLGPILVQLPPNLPKDMDNLAKTLELFGHEVRVAVEFRHDSWWDDEVRELLTDKGAALSWADRGEKPIAPLWKTADWGYHRFHQGFANPVPCYKRATLAEWVQRIKETWEPEEDVYVFFNNDPQGCALRDAAIFADYCAKEGLDHTRVAPAEEIIAGRLPSDP